MLPRGMRWADMYPGYQTEGVDSSRQSTTIAASSPAAASPTAPAMVLVAIIVLLVALRVVYELAPTGGKGI